MRRFNPEKELNKIQHGNKDKIIAFIFMLLIVGVMGYSFALYQVRYSKRIIYTQVAPFYNKDIILSVKLDDQEKSMDKFPTKEEGYVYSHIECENGNITNDSWNDKDWNLTASIKGPDKCTVFFVKSPFHMKSCENKTMSECLLNEGQKFTNILAYDDPEQNGRYYGKYPDNYIWFNCDDYDSLTQETAKTKCEKWRIIGAFNNIDKVISVSGDVTTYDKQNLVKIIRADSIGNIAWDVNRSNNWSIASLQKGLNGPYLEKTDDGTWITEPEYTSDSDSNSKEDNYKGITANTKRMIEKVRWNIGGPEPYRDSNAAQFYEDERGIIVSPGLPTTWDGYVGLIYPSDYGYATSGLEDNETTNRNGCLNSALFTWNTGDYKTNCARNSWLLSSPQWVIMPIGSPCACTTHIVGGDGLVYQAYTVRPYIVRPTLYLKSNVKILSGDGTYESPYVLSV